MRSTVVPFYISLRHAIAQGSGISMTMRLSGCVTASIHGDGVVLLHTIDGRLFTSNQVGARVWCCLERGLSVEAIAAEISDEYR
ncbi:MAG: PqqD family protein, partial [bacterium]